MATAIEVRERPILFSGPMVKAILSGKKTQTRRVVGNLGIFVDTEMSMGPGRLQADGSWMWPDGTTVKCPYGALGDRLWVREAWTLLDREHWGDDRRPKDWIDPLGTRRRNACAYRADCNDADGERCWQDYIRAGYPYQWKPSIHMPRWASRLTLSIVGIRTERLQAITDEDALAEGVDAIPVADLPRLGSLTFRGDFGRIWEKINGKRPGCTWKENPWVWRIEFRRVEREE